MKPLVVLVSGDRHGTNLSAVQGRLSRHAKGTWVIHGDAPGVDTLADKACPLLSFVRIRVPYLGHLGRRGGPARNKVMLDILLALRNNGHSVLVEAFHDDIDNSRGTANMVSQAEKAKVPYTVTRLST